MTDRSPEQGRDPAPFQRAREIFEAALAQPPAERALLVERACGGDAVLAADVEGMLRADATPHRWLDGRVLLAADRLESGDVIAEHLQIIESIGSGGMGEVYRAHDTRLGRDVAVKVLPPTVGAAEHADRLARFRREAQVLASLNHPNIAAIHGLEDAEGVHALVLELIDGPTLADRIAAGPIPLDHVVAIARQIAEALEAAHERGIVHRDLKPSNIKLRPDGAVKLLDFGLAKVLATDIANVATAWRHRHSPVLPWLRAVSYSAHRPTSVQNRRVARRPTGGVTFGPSAPCSTRCCRGGAPFRARTPPTRLRRFCERRLSGPLWIPRLRIAFVGWWGAASIETSDGGCVTSAKHGSCWRSPMNRLSPAWYPVAQHTRFRGRSGGASSFQPQRCPDWSCRWRSRLDRHASGRPACDPVLARGHRSERAVCRSAVARSRGHGGRHAHHLQRRESRREYPVVRPRPRSARPLSIDEWRVAERPVFLARWAMGRFLRAWHRSLPPQGGDLRRAATGDRDL